MALTTWTVRLATDRFPDSGLRATEAIPLSGELHRVGLEVGAQTKNETLPVGDPPLAWPVTVTVSVVVAPRAIGAGLTVLVTVGVKEPPPPLVTSRHSVAVSLSLTEL
jgi:hypothetical protein